MPTSSPVCMWTPEQKGPLLQVLRCTGAPWPAQQLQRYLGRCLRRTRCQFCGPCGSGLLCGCPDLPRSCCCPASEDTIPVIKLLTSQPAGSLPWGHAALYPVIWPTGSIMPGPSAKARAGGKHRNPHRPSSRPSSGVITCRQCSRLLGTSWAARAWKRPEAGKGSPDCSSSIPVLPVLWCPDHLINSSTIGGWRIYQIFDCAENRSLA